jgi:uncharacterized protein (DUF2267 family)
MAMDYERFLSIVAREASLDREAAERATRATLETLSERLMEGHARRIAEALPEEPARWLRPKGGRETFHADEFLRRVAEREGVDVPTAEQHARAVFLALSRAVPGQEFRDMLAELPKDFDPLVGKARPPSGVMPAEEFTHRVADRAGVDEAAARRATEAVLETLAERLAGGEVEDVRKELPPELHAALRRGKDRVHGVARSMTLDEFLSLVAEREGATVDRAREDTRAVFATLRDALIQKTFTDVDAELPKEYDALLARA